MEIRYMQSNIREYGQNDGNLPLARTRAQMNRVPIIDLEFVHPRSFCSLCGTTDITFPFLYTYTNPIQFQSVAFIPIWC